jgi:hypothetical protein
LIADESHAAIRGVRVKTDNGAEETILADLVVDASGRGSSSPAWLESFGYARAQEEKIEIGIGYTTRVYRRRPTDLGGKLAVVIAGSGPNWRNGTILSVVIRVIYGDVRWYLHGSAGGPKPAPSGAEL